MKKLIAVLTLMLAFTINANAQDRKVANEQAAKADVQKLTEAVALKPEQQQNFLALFQMKHNILNDANVAQERKAEMSRVVAAKLRATLTSGQMEKLEANPTLLGTMTGNATATTEKVAAKK